MAPQVQQKWQTDCLALPLFAQHQLLYTAIHRSSWLGLGSFPDLIAGTGFNDKIQWLKLFGQDLRMSQLTDKLLLKDIVSDVLGPEYVARTYQVVKRFQRFNFDLLPDKAVLKANHDSGSVYFVHNKDDFPRDECSWRLNRAVRRMYGGIGGEWQYWFIAPRLFAEELLPFEHGAPPPDYKFHCADGQVLWQQFICDRGHQTKEVITDPDGKVMGIQFDQHMTPVQEFRMPDNWQAMVEVAETLSRGFPYVRVDLYNVNGRIVVGEMTFTPLNGLYRSEGNELLGRLIPLDRSQVRPIISDAPGACTVPWW